MPLALGDPHPDAILIEAEILGLDAAIKRATEAREPLQLNLDGYRIGYRLGAKFTGDGQRQLAAENPQLNAVHVVGPSSIRRQAGYEADAASLTRSAAPHRPLRWRSGAAAGGSLLDAD
ncbi:hypothetical protein [Methylobacterium hispanicum]|uniref:hypothetical protein n=1 Tax=Methylobacterium hispanicum TaxID=270350 RepID=UPI002F359246